jgi:hypothetical protein
MQTRFFQTAIKTIQHLLPTAADLKRGVAGAGREHLKYIEVKCEGKRVDITACSGRILMRIRKPANFRLTTRPTLMGRL